jgi:hypothetical protein
MVSYKSTSTGHMPVQPTTAIDESTNSTKKADSTDVTTSQLPATKKRKTTRNVWMNFTKDKEGSKDPKAVCNYCKSQLLGKTLSVTQHLRRHLELCKAFQSSSSSSKQSLLVATKGSMNQMTLQFSEKKTQGAPEISKMVAAHDYPCQMVEHKYFKLFVASLQPNYKLKTRFTFKEDCMNCFQSMKVNLLKKISQAKRSALTTNLWSSCDANEYMVITAHFMDASWKSITHVISFKELPMPHTGVAIAD